MRVPYQVPISYAMDVEDFHRLPILVRNGMFPPWRGIHVVDHGWDDGELCVSKAKMRLWNNYLANMVLVRVL